VWSFLCAGQRALTHVLNSLSIQTGAIALSRRKVSFVMITHLLPYLET
jgi:hypothetical protein